MTPYYEFVSSNGQLHPRRPKWPILSQIVAKPRQARSGREVSLADPLRVSEGPYAGSRRRREFVGRLPAATKLAVSSTSPTSTRMGTRQHIAFSSSSLAKTRNLLQRGGGHHRGTSRQPVSTTAPLFCPFRSRRGDALASRRMTLRSIYRVLVSYLQRLPGAMHEIELPTVEKNRQMSIRRIRCGQQRERSCFTPACLSNPSRTCSTTSTSLPHRFTIKATVSEGFRLILGADLKEACYAQYRRNLP